MCCRVCRVHELARDKAVRDLFCKLFCFCDCSLHTFGTLGQNQLCTVCFQHVSSLNTHGLRHCQDDAVAFGCCDRCKTDTSVSRSRLNDHRTFFEDSFLLSILDHSFCHTILYASCRIEVLKLYKKLCFQTKLFLNVCYLHQRSVSNQSKCSFVNICHFLILHNSYPFTMVFLLLIVLYSLFSYLSSRFLWLLQSHA